MFVLVHGSGLFMTRSGLFSPVPRPDIFFEPEEAFRVLRVAYNQCVHVYAVCVSPEVIQKEKVKSEAA